MSYITATGLYPTDNYQSEPVSINLNLGNVFENQSNQLVNQINNTSNTLIHNIKITSNQLIQYTNTTGSNIISYIDGMTGKDYAWDEALLEPLNHLSSIHQVYDNNIHQELDSYLFRYYFLTKNALKEARTKTVVPSYSPYIYHVSDYKKWFGYVGWALSPDLKGGFKIVTDDTTQIGAYDAQINISLLLNFPSDIYVPSNPAWQYNGIPIITGWYVDNTHRTFRIVFGVIDTWTSVTQSTPLKRRFITIQYASQNHVANTDAYYPEVDEHRYYLPENMTFEEYHFWSFNIQRDRFWIYCDGSLVFTSPQIIYYPNPGNFYFGIRELYLEDRNFNLTDSGFQRFKFADLYYFKRHLTPDEVSSLSKHVLSSMRNTLRVYGTIECDRIITNQIIDYDYTEKQFKKLTYDISQVSNLQNILDYQENSVTLLTPDRVIVTDPNSQIGRLTTSSITSNNLEDMQKLIQTYNPVIEFVKDTFGADIQKFVDANPNIVTLGVSAGSALYTFLTGGINTFNANNRIPRRYITQHQDAGGDLRIYYPNLTNDDGARIYISETFKNSYINNKQPTITGGATSITNDNLTPNKVLISDGNGKVATSNNIDLVKLSYLNNVNSDIQSQINNKQPNLTVSTDSIISIVNDVINTEWKKSGNDITYNTGNIIVDNNIEVDKIKIDTELKVCDPTLYCSNQYVRVIGNTELKNANSINDYAVLNPLLLSLTKRVVFEPNNMGVIQAKELISKTTLNYGYANYLNGIYAGHVQNGSGNLYVYDQNISSYPLNTISASVSFWCYSPNNMVLDQEYRYIRIFAIDQDKYNILNYDRPKIRVLLGQGYNGLSQLFENIINVQYTYSSESTWQSIFDPVPTIGTSATKPGIDADLKIPRFYSFNFTYNSCTVFVNGVQIATNTIPNMPQYEFRLENFFFPQQPYQTDYLVNQNYRFWNAYMNYNRLYTVDEVASLYRYETDNLMNTLKVNGIIRTTALATDTIYLKGQEFNLPSSYNQKSLYEQAQETGKITIQDKTNNRRSLSIDTTEVNTVKNIINNTGNSGFWYYADGNQDTQAQIKTISITDVNNLSTTLDNKLNKTATANSVMITDASGNIIPSGSITTTELGYLDGLNELISTTLDNKLNKTATANSVMITDASGNIIPSGSITTTELGYLDGLNELISTSLGNKQDKLTIAVNKLVGTNSTTPNSLTSISIGNGLTLSGGTLSLSGTASQWTTNGNNIYYSVGNVGIGTQTNITHKLQINTSSSYQTATNLFNFKNEYDYGIYATSIGNDASGNSLDFYSKDFNLGQGDLTRSVLSMKANGSVGVGNNSPYYKLDVSGDINYTGTLRLNAVDVLAGKQNNITGGATSITSSDLLGDRVLISNSSGKVAVSSVTSTQLGYLDVSQSISTLLSSKLNKNIFTGSAVMVTDASGNIIPSPLISTPQLNYLNGLSDNISTLLGQKEPSFAVLPVSKGGTSLGSIQANKLLGSGSSADTIQAISIGTGLSLSGGSLSLSGGGAGIWIQDGITGKGSYNPAQIALNQVNNVGIGTTNPNGLLELYSSTQASSRIILSGQEFYQTANTSTSGIAFLLGVNRTNNRQLWIGDSANLAQNATNSTFRINTGDNAGSGASIDSIATNGTTALPLKLGTAGAITILANKNVGIGNTQPFAPLCVGHSGQDGSDGYIVLGKKQGGGTMNFRIGQNVNFDYVVGTFGNNNNAGTWTEQFKVSYQASANSLYIDQAGRIKLASIASYRRISLYEVADNDHQIVGLGASGGLTFQNPNTNDAFQWRAGTGSASSTELMRLTGGANLGVGISPSARLHIASGSTSISGSYGFLNLGGAFGNNSTANSTLCAIFESSIWSKNTVFASSDVRIKKNIKDIDDDSALQKILSIEPKTYNYIDNVYRGSNLIYGFVAQQIKEVIPEAVSIQEEVIPNIYDKCEYSSNTLTFDSNIDLLTKSDICVGSNITLYDINNVMSKYNIINYSSNTITIDKQNDSTCNLFFAYGTEVKDFHSLDKNYIYTLNVCATQELHRIVQRQNDIINSLVGRIEALEKYYIQ